MKNLQHIFKNCFLAILLGGLLFSCITSEPTGPAAAGEDDEYGEEGLMSIVLYADNNGPTGRAIDMRAPIDIKIKLKEEDRLRSVRIILYRANSGKAVYIKDYDLENQYPGEWKEVNPSSLQTKAFKVNKGNYKLAVLVNYDNKWIYYGTDADRDLEATDIAYRTSRIGHHMSELTEKPLDFSNDADAVNLYQKNYRARTYAMQTLGGVYDMKIVNLLFDDEKQEDETYQTWYDNAYFFMSNADGLIDITPEDIYDYDTTAEAAPVEVRVERALAKVVLVANPDMYLWEYLEPLGLAKRAAGPSSQSVMRGYWFIDAVNTQVYPIRKQTFSAPYSTARPLLPETFDTPRLDRYAEDPNPNATPSQIANDFYRLPENLPFDPVHKELFNVDNIYTEEYLYYVTSDGIEDELFVGDIYGPHGMLPSYIQYVTENTLEDGAPYSTEVASNLLLAIPLQYKFNTREINSGDNYDTYPTSTYVVYRGGVYPWDMLYNWLTGDSEYTEYADYITEQPITLAFWEADFDTQEKKDDLKALIFDAYGDPIAGYHTYGGEEIVAYAYINFFRAPIPHFTSTQSPGPDKSYGRHGVVRNNTYILTLDGLKGLGSPVYPKDIDVTDENNYISVSGTVLPWLYRHEGYDLGSGGSGGGVR